MKSVDYIKAYLENKNLNYVVVTPLTKEYRWKWAIRLDNIDVYMIHNSRFLIMKKDQEGLLTYIEAYVKSKYEVTDKLEELI